MNKCVLITGGCRNSGLGIARKFAEEGYDVFLTSRSGNCGCTDPGIWRFLPWLRLFADC